MPATTTEEKTTIYTKGATTSPRTHRPSKLNRKVRTSARSTARVSKCIEGGSITIDNNSVSVAVDVDVDVESGPPSSPRSNKDRRSQRRSGAILSTSPEAVKPPDATTRSTSQYDRNLCIQDEDDSCDDDDDDSQDSHFAPGAVWVDPEGEHHVPRHLRNSHQTRLDGAAFSDVYDDGSGMIQMTTLDSSSGSSPTPFPLGGRGGRGISLTSDVENRRYSTPDALKDGSSSRTPSSSRRRAVVLALVLVVTVLVLGTVAALVLLNKSKNDDNDDNNLAATGIPSVPTDAPTGSPDYFPMAQDLLSSMGVTVSTVPSNPTYQATDWLANHDPQQLIVASSQSEEGVVVVKLRSIDTMDNDEKRLLLERYVWTVFYYSTHSDPKEHNIMEENIDGNYDDIGTAGWVVEDKWLSNANTCDWYGIFCNDQNYTVQFDLGDNGLRGTIPTELGYVDSLIEIALNDNLLSSTIPSEISQLTNLQRLWLGRNQLTGTLPPTLGTLSVLKELFFYENQLTGTIPSQFGSQTGASTLEILDGRSNLLTGTIPTELGNLLQLHELVLDNNQISGTIPSELGHLDTSLYRLYLGNNYIQGSIPTVIGNLTQMEFLHLAYNHITGTLPSELGRLTIISGFYMNRNLLKGTIPTEFKQLTKLEFFDAENTALTGIWTPIFCSSNDRNSINSTQFPALTSITADCLFVSCSCCQCFP